MIVKTVKNGNNFDITLSYPLSQLDWETEDQIVDFAENHLGFEKVASGAGFGFRDLIFVGHGTEDEIKEKTNKIVGTFPDYNFTLTIEIYEDE